MRVHTDANFSFLIIILSITLLSLITGFEMARLVGSPFQDSKFMFSVLFLVLSILIISVAIMVPYSLYVISNFSIIIGILKFMELAFYFVFRRNILLKNFGMSIVLGEVLSALLLVIAGILLSRVNE
ncbi:MAG: hypothetical protein ACP5OZ_00850 [Candidatus Woesearchaeota archaeon]